jgi:hypothetical protein
LSQNWFRTYAADTGRYVQSDPIGLRGGLNTFGYVGGDPIMWFDPKGMIKHTTGKTIECAKNCTIRIDMVLDEKTGIVRRHIHWECRGNVGAAGEHGGNSHGGNCDSMPAKVKECAKAAGFKCDPVPPPPPAQSSTCDQNCQKQVGTVMTVLGTIYLTYRMLCGGPF